MTKFECLIKEGAEMMLCKHNENFESLINFGHFDLRIAKKSKKSNSTTNHQKPEYNFHNYDKPLTGKEFFVPKRFIVVQMIETEKIKRKRLQEEREKDEKSFSQLEEWTKLKCGEIIFNSDVDDWNNQKVFNSRVFGKEHLVVICEDFKGNKFGGFINATVGKIWSDREKECIKDPQSFLFSLKSNGRLKGMMKFESIEEGGAEITLFKHDDPDENWSSIINFGYGDFEIWRYPIREKSRCNWSSHPDYDFHRIEYPLRGTDLWFTPKRFYVIQMK